MSRKPIDKQQPSECRQAICDWIRVREGIYGPLATFTIKDIDVKLELTSIREYLTGLIKAGYLSAVISRIRGHKDVVVYTLVMDTGHDAPRVRKDGTPVTQGQGRLQMWNAMQVLKEFNPRDLSFNASTEEHKVAESEAKIYCAALCASGYLVGRANGRYMLVTAMWSGPQPPQIQRTKQVYDPNLRRVVWARIEGGAE
jgi:hypothetical protein